MSKKIAFEEISSFVENYNHIPSKEVLLIETEKRSDMNETTFKEVASFITSLDECPAEFEWLCDTTEKWCRDRAIYLALMESINIADGNDEKKSPDAIPSILSDARSHLTITSVTITYRTMNHVMKVTTGRKTRLNLISNTLTRSRKVVSLTKLLTSRFQYGVGKVSIHVTAKPSCSRTERSIHYNGNGRRKI